MVVGYVSDALASDELYGLGRYARELEHQLLCRGFDMRRYSLDRCDANDRCTFLPWGRKIHALLWSTIGLPRFEQWAPSIDLVHSVEMSYPVATRKPWVVTIHDLGPLTHPEYFSKARPWLIRRALAAAVRRATAIICVSQATADSVEMVAGVPLGDRLHVVHEGVSRRFFRPIELDAATKVSCLPRDTPYFLWTGSLSPRKNLATVVDAFESVAPKLPHHLVLTGKLHWEYHDVVRRIEASPYSPRIHRIGYVNEDCLRELYTRADAYLYVSLMEGFGLPILEAMAAGCPVITSNCSCMPEIAGDAAILVDPVRSGELADAMMDVARNKDVCARLAERGRTRAASFTWESCAEKVAEVYMQVAQA